MTPLVGAIIAFGLLVVVPLAAGLLPGGALLRLRCVWLAAAVPASLALTLGRGPLAATLVLPLAAVALAVAGSDAARAARAWTVDAPAVVASGAALVVAAATLFAERAGLRLAGFELTVLALTPPHMLYAGVVAVLLAAAVARRAPTRISRPAAWGVPLGVGIVLVGYVVGDWLELAGTLVLTAAIWAATWSAWSQSAGAGRRARILIGASGAVGVGTMLLACAWAIGEATGLAHPTLGVMVATHGVGNAVGLTLCGVLGWRLLESGSSRSPGRTHTTEAT